MSAEDKLIAAIRAAKDDGHELPAGTVAELIDALPDRQAQAMRLYYLEGETNKSAIARAMGVSNPRVHQLLDLGRQRLVVGLATRIPQQYLTCLLPKSS